MMILDLVVYINLHGFKCELLFAFELTIVFFYLIIFVYMTFKGFRTLDEDVEFFLVCVRMTLQFSRLIVALVRAGEAGKNRAIDRETNLDIEAGSKSARSGKTVTELPLDPRELVVI